MPNSEFHVQKWSFNPKFPNLVHKCTSWNFHVKSGRKMFQSKMKSVSWVLIKMQVQARMGLSMSWEVQWRKSFSSLEKCVLSQSEKWWSEWKVEFWNIEVFITWKFWFVNENFPKWMLDPLFLIKNVFVFSHLDSSLTLQRKMVQMRLKGSKYEVYIHA